VRRRATALAVMAALTCGAAGSARAATLKGLHDARYCEILELKGGPPNGKVTVWNTIGLNECPAAAWSAFDAPSLAAELDDTLVVLNGPRHFLMDAATGATGGTRAFHGLRTRKVATIPIRTAAELVQAPYTDRTVSRSNSWRWSKGRTVFELVAPGGDTYVMQSYAQIVDRNLTLARLRTLGRRLELPLGWRYRTRKLARPLVLKAQGGKATILQDELQNTYQLATTTRTGKRKAHAVNVEGVTSSVAPATKGTVEDHGRLTGTPFGKGRIVLVGTFGGGSLTATFRLTFPRGSIIGTTTLPFTITGNEIDFEGTSRFTGGTGAFRGISSGPLATHDHNTLDGQNGRLSVTGSARY
jgi:hypothetical protein